MVEVKGLEPPTSWTQTKSATNCATPRRCGVYNTHRFYCNHSIAFNVVESPAKRWHKTVFHRVNIYTGKGPQNV